MGIKRKNDYVETGNILPGDFVGAACYDALGQGVVDAFTGPRDSANLEAGLGKPLRITAAYQSQADYEYPAVPVQHHFSSSV